MQRGRSVDRERRPGLRPRAIHDKEEVGEKRGVGKRWKQGASFVGKTKRR